MSALEDDLLEQAVAGDQDALAQLLECDGPEVRARLVAKMPRRWQSVLSEDDVMQQTYADAFLDIGRFVPRGEGSFTAWLATLANRNLTDAIRMLEAEKRGGNRRRVEPGANDESFVALYELLGGTSTTPSRYAARNEAKVALTKAIERLPDPYRVVITKYDLEGRPLKEVAQALRRTAGATSMLRARAHQRLAEIMGTASRFLSGSA